MVKITNHAYIRDQQVKIYKNQCFLFKFTSFEFLTVFSTAVFTGSWWLRQINVIKKPMKTFDFLNSKSKGKWTKIVAMSV